MPSKTHLKLSRRARKKSFEVDNNNKKQYEKTTLARTRFFEASPVGRNDGAELAQTVPSDRLGLAGKPHSLGVSEALGFAAELFEKNAILFLKVLNHRLLVSVHPTDHHEKEELQLCVHGRQRTVKATGAQA